LFRFLVNARRPTIFADVYDVVNVTVIRNGPAAFSAGLIGKHLAAAAAAAAAATRARPPTRRRRPTPRESIPIPEAYRRHPGRARASDQFFLAFSRPSLSRFARKS